MKKLLLLTSSLFIVTIATQANRSLAQEGPSITDTSQVDSEAGPIQTELDNALALFYDQFPQADVVEINIHQHRENLDYVFKIEGIHNFRELEMKVYQGQTFVSFDDTDDEDNEDDIIDLTEVYSVDYLTQEAIKYSGFSTPLDWELEYSDDYHETVWEIELTDGYYHVDVKLGAVTGNLLEIDYEDSDDDDDDDYYQEFYNNPNNVTTIAPEITTQYVETTQSSNSMITYDQAVSIATNYFGYGPSQVYLEEVELDEDDGYYYYEVEFYVGGYEFEVDVEAYSGSVLSAERDDD